MRAVGSSKLISNRELFYIVVLLQQGGVFWLLPYFILKENGTAGMLSLLPGLAVGALIISICSFWSAQCQEQTFFQALTGLLGKPLGKLVGLCFTVFYICFAVSCLHGFMEVVAEHLLAETPRIVIACTIFFLLGWLSWHGLEDIARLVVLCAVLVLVLVLLALAGSVQIFSLENLLPLEIKAPQQLKLSVLHSIFAYSGLMTLFMLYPAVRKTSHIKRQLWTAMLLSTGVFVFWLVLGLGMFGQYTTGSMTWLPIELARMIQISSFLERTEALFAVLWMAVVFANGSVLVWCVSESVHQLFGQQKNIWLHSGAIVLLVVICTSIKNVLQLLKLERIFALLNIGLIPVLLLILLLGAWLRRRKEETRYEGTDVV